MRILQRFGAALVGLLLVSAVAAPSSYAHADLASSDPAAGAALAVAPSAVTLTFSEELVADTVNVALSDEGGPLEGIVAKTDGAVVTVPWPTEAGAGSYTVAYRVVSQDGHPIDGSFDFTVAAGTVAEATPAAETSAAAETPPVIASEQPYEPTGPEDGSVNWVMVVVVMLFGVGAFLALLIAGRKNARRKW